MLQYVRRVARFESLTRLDWFLFFLLFTILHIPGIINFYHNDGENNPYLLFAGSLLKGHLTLPVMPDYMDMISYQGDHYLPYPPMPSIILMPLVAIFGTHHVNTVFVVIVMSCLNLYLVYRLLLRLKVAQEWFPWLIAAFFFGTGYWYALFTSHHVYAFAQITSCTFQLLLINELLGKKRWWLAGIYIGCSFLTRQMTICYGVFALGYMWYLHREGLTRIRFKDLAGLALSSGFFMALYLLYNYVRFGNPTDPGYAHILFIGELKERVDRYGVFSSKYFLFNFYTYFIKGFNIEFTGPGLLKIKDMDLWGTSLLAASPFLVASLKARWPGAALTPGNTIAPNSANSPIPAGNPLAPDQLSWIPRLAAWLTILLILTGLLFYHNNGYFQINTIRFTLDFLPLLFVLTALGIQSVGGWLLKGMIGYAILLNLVSFVIHFLYQKP